MQSDRKAGLARGTKCVRTRKHAAQLTKEPSPNASVRFARCRSAKVARLQVLDVMSMITIRSATRSEVRPPPRPRKAFETEDDQNERSSRDQRQIFSPCSRVK